MGGLSKTYGRIIENLSVTYGNFIAKAWPTYGEIMALRSNKFIENLAINPVREHISKWPEFDSRSEQHLVTRSCSLRQSWVRSPVGTLFQADPSWIPSFPQQNSSLSRVRIRALHAAKLSPAGDKSAIIFR